MSPLTKAQANPNWGPSTKQTDQNSSKVSRSWKMRKTDWRNSHRLENRDIYMQWHPHINPGPERKQSQENCWNSSNACRFLSSVLSMLTPFFFDGYTMTMWSAIIGGSWTKGNENSVLLCNFSASLNLFLSEKFMKSISQASSANGPYSKSSSIGPGSLVFIEN